MRPHRRPAENRNELTPPHVKTWGSLRPGQCRRRRDSRKHEHHDDLPHLQPSGGRVANRGGCWRPILDWRVAHYASVGPMSESGHFHPLCSMGRNGSSSLNSFPADRMPATEGLGQKRWWGAPTPQAHKADYQALGSKRLVLVYVLKAERFGGFGALAFRIDVNSIKSRNPRQVSRSAWLLRRGVGRATTRCLALIAVVSWWPI
jgi:hypothetical protein